MSGPHVLFAQKASAESADLFSDIQYRGSMDRFSDPTIIRTRFVKIDFDQLTGPSGTDTARVAHSLDLNLFGGIFYRAVSRQVDRYANGRTIWQGQLEDIADSQVTLVFKDGIMAGNIVHPDGFYQIRFVSGGVHAIHELDHSRFPSCAVDEDAGQTSYHHGYSSTSINISQPADNGSSIDVMVVYNQEARIGAGSTTAIENEIDLAVSETNTGYANSGVSQRIKLVHTAEVNYSPSGSIFTDRSRLQNTADGYMDEIHDLRDTFGADIVALITEDGGGYCGVAALMTSVSTSMKSSAFCVVKRSCATGYYSFGHELGHIMGARHDRYVDNTDNSPYQYNHGYVNVSEQWRTIMAYNNECSDASSYCWRINYWSNPNKTYVGDPLGLAEGDPAAADNHKTLNNTAYTVANFRQHVSDPVAATITVTSPDGGEIWTVGTTKTIQWTSTGSVGDVKIEYSSDRGTSWNTVVSSTSNDGSYSWTIPNDVSNQCVVRISEASDGNPSDTSGANFTIQSSVPVSSTISVTSPNGGESLTGGSVYTINWSSTGTVGNVTIKYSSNNGSSWSNITSSTANDGVFKWTVPNITASQCLIKISEAADGDPTDVSDGVFSITATSSPTLAITSPNGGETLSVGEKFTVRWTSTGGVGNVKLQYSSNNGSNWSNLVTSTANDGAFSWTVPNSTGSKCLVKISEAADGDPSDTSDETFSISTSVTPTITITSPNGGESIQGDTTYNIEWTSSGSVGNVKIQYSVNNGSTWTNIATSTANDGNYSWKVPEIESSGCYIKISEASDGSPSDVSNSTFSIFTPEPAEIKLSRMVLDYGANTSGVVTGAQSVLIDNTGGQTLNWTAAAIGTSWLSVSPASGIDSGVISISINPAGMAPGNYTGTVEVSDPNASNSPQSIAVNVKVYGNNQTSTPTGDFSTPANGATVSSSVPVTGWVIDDIEAVSVKIYNDTSYVGDAVFVEGARPDIEKNYYGFPKNYQAGWGYMLLTHFLPGGGNGTYTLVAKATDAEGNTVTLGSKTITITNSSAVKPFGAIDTPAQGGTASGNKFVNWGWVLTPQPNNIPVDGSTIFVWVDGVNLGNPVYNIYRSDIATKFPGYANSDGAIGYYFIDTSAYENGIHTIQWTAKDTAGNTDGIGSRYFSIQNTGKRSAASGITQTDFTRHQVKAPRNLLDVEHVPLDRHRSVRVRRGYGRETLLKTESANGNGEIIITIHEMQRLEVHFFNDEFERNGELLSPFLPVGSTLNKKKGIFYWQPGLGFLGRHEFEFVTFEGGTAQPVRVKLTVIITPSS